VDRPVVSRNLAELAGAVERIDDPHALRAEPHVVVLALLGEDGVRGPGLAQSRHEQLVGLGISGGAELGGLTAPALAQPQEKVARTRGELAGQGMVSRHAFPSLVNRIGQSARLGSVSPAA
jgi:hypothetical protein